MRALAATLSVLLAGCFQPWSLDNLLYRCGGGCPESFICDDGVCCRPGDEPACPTLVPDGGVCSGGVAPKPWYPDNDGDGYGDPTQGRLACHRPLSTPYVDNADDCDDTSAAAHPGGTEVCDGRDNNCDGHIDENQTPLTTYYRDVDGDGYGDPSDTLMACNCMVACVPPGYSDQAGDCAPMDGMRHPFAREHCNGLDDDCDGLTDNGMLANVGDACSDAGVGLCGPGTLDCTGGTLVCHSTYVPSLDVCDDQDNDCDGLTDEQPDCGGPVNLLGPGIAYGAQNIGTLTFAQQTSRCLKNWSGATTETWSKPSWSGSGGQLHIWWAEAPNNTTWDLSRGPKLSLDFNWAVTSAAAAKTWAALKQPVLYLCSADGSQMNRYVHIPMTLLPETTQTSGAVSSVVDFGALSDSSWNIGASAGLDITKVKRIELLVQPQDSTPNPTFTITFLPDAGFSP